MNKQDIINELNEMGYEVKEENNIRNGVTVEEISIIDSDRYMIPKFDINGIIENAESMNVTARDVAEEMLRIHNDGIRESKELDKPIVFSKENLMANLYVGVQGKSCEDIVKRSTQFEGIEEYLYLRIGAIEGFYTTKIKQEMLWQVGLDETEAWEVAEKNLEKEIEIARMVMLPIEEEKKMFVISNKAKYRGASAVLNSKVIKTFAEHENTKKIMVLPSSIHEMILIPWDEDADIEEDLATCSQMVQMVNHDKVMPEERLADRAYIIEL